MVRKCSGNVRKCQEMVRKWSGNVRRNVRKWAGDDQEMSGNGLK